MFHNQKIQRAISAVVILTFTSLTMTPFTAMAQAHDTLDKTGYLPKQNVEGLINISKRDADKLNSNAGKTTGAGERFAQLLAAIHDDLKTVSPETAMPPEARPGYWKQATAMEPASGRETPTRALGPNMRIDTERAKLPALKPLPGTDIAARVKSIHAKALDAKRLYPEIEKSFKDTEQHLKDAKLPPEILKRHQDAVAQYQSRKTEFERLMGNLAKAGTGKSAAGAQRAALADLGGFMAKYPNAKPHQYTDPNKLPFGTPGNKVRAPYASKAEYQAGLFPPQYDKLNLASLSLDGIQLAQATLPYAPDAADLAETDDVQITQAIRDQAIALGKSPVKIYNWVRNNIQFIPSYGSIQGSGMTLQNKKGNAFDTASLLIALYRSAGIPARYVYGTIDVPADKVMNWVGGVSKAEAAQSLLGQGGIPNIALTSGGVIKAIRMEHVWVEAFVDYGPSRGAVNRKPDTWIPVDASFKQYQFARGMDIRGNVPISAQNLDDQIKQGATVNASQGWIQHPNQVNLQTQLNNYQSMVSAYIDSQKVNATVDDVLGAQKIIAQNYSIMLGTLPYQTSVTGNTYQTLPDNLRWKFKTNVYAADGVGDGGNPIVALNQSTAKLAGKKITLSFVPATKADEDVVNSYLPRAHLDGTPIQLSELPGSLPGYLLNMKAVFRVDGQTVAQTTGGLTMGSGLKQSTQYFNPSNGLWQGGADNDITVGEYDAIGLDLQGTGIQQLKNHQAKLEATATKLIQYRANPSDATPTGGIAGLTMEDLTGDIVQSGILAYFTQVDANDQLTAKADDDVVSYRLPSYGRFFVEARPRLWFGMIQSVTFPGFGMDVDALAYGAEAKNNVPANRIKYLRQIGAAGSAAEHGIPEQLFRNPRKPADDPAQPQGISAVRVISIAASQGQKIYTLHSGDAASQSTVNSLGIGADVKTEIANALAAGKEVTVHEKDVAINGWTGSGYIIIDTDTGAGAYKLDGGTNGGAIPSCVGLAAMVLVALIFAFIIAVILLPFIIEAAIGVAAIAGSTATAIKIAVAAFLLSYGTFAAAGTSNGNNGGVLCGGWEYCLDQFEDDINWCDNNFIKWDKFACHQWSDSQLDNCKNNRPREPFRL